MDLGVESGSISARLQGAFESGTPRYDAGSPPARPRACRRCEKARRVRRASAMSVAASLRRPAPRGRARRRNADAREARADISAREQERTGSNSGAGPLKSRGCSLRAGPFTVHQQRVQVAHRPPPPPAALAAISSKRSGSLLRHHRRAQWRSGRRGDVGELGGSEKSMTSVGAARRGLSAEGAIGESSRSSRSPTCPNVGGHAVEPQSAAGFTLEGQRRPGQRADAAAVGEAAKTCGAPARRGRTWSPRRRGRFTSAAHRLARWRWV